MNKDKNKDGDTNEYVGRKRKLREGMEDVNVHGAGIVGDLGIYSR